MFSCAASDHKYICLMAICVDKYDSSYVMKQNNIYSFLAVKVNFLLSQSSVNQHIDLVG